MLHSAHRFRGFAVHATDGDIGSIADLLFDDTHWTVRYCVIDTGGWLTGRQVLISPIVIRSIDWDAQRVDVGLSREQIEGGPGIDADQPVSRQHETALAEYYGYQPYWYGPSIWGGGLYPAPLGYPRPALTPATGAASIAGPASGTPGNSADATGQDERGDPHLRSASEVTGYRIAATDDDIGHVEDLLVDDETWSIRYFEIDTRNWWPGKKVLIAPRWVSGIDWTTSTVTVEQSRDTIKQAPEYDEGQPIDRSYEQQLHQHYRQSPYWEHEQTRER